MSDINEVLAELKGFKELVEVKFDSFTEVNTNEHNRIEYQTTKTNGSVAKAFIKIDEINKWKERIIGGMVLISIIFTVVTTLLLIYVNYKR